MSKTQTTFITADDTVICANLLTAQTPRLTPTGKISHAKTRVYTQRYRKEWEQMPDFKGWLTSVPYQQTRAFCTYCKKNLHAHRLSLLKHTCTMKHQRAALAHEAEKEKSESTQGDNSETEIEYVEVEAMDNQTEEGEENEEEIEYIVEKLDTDEEESMELQDKGDEEEVVGEEEEEAKEIDNDLCAQLESDDETSKPVIKKIKLEAQNKCQDALAKAMAHVHSEYLDEEIENQENVQMEMVVEESNNTETVSIQPDSADDIKESSTEKRNNVPSHTEIIKNDKKSSGKVLQGDDKNVVVTCPLPVVGTAYQIDSSNKTITLTSGGKTLTLTGGTFQPGTQYVLKKIKGKLPTLVADKKSTTAVNQNNSEKVINVTKTVQAGTSQQSSKKLTKTVQKGLRISTHVIDITKGLPVCGLQVSLYKLMDGRWTFLNESTTNPTGRCVDLIDKAKLSCIAGRYKIHFDVDKYFTLRRIETMYPFIEIVFDVKNPTGQYHIPILLSPFGYSTFRDS